MLTTPSFKTCQDCDQQEKYARGYYTSQYDYSIVYQTTYNSIQFNSEVLLDLKVSLAWLEDRAI